MINRIDAQAALASRINEHSSQSASHRKEAEDMEYLWRLLKLSYSYGGSRTAPYLDTTILFKVGRQNNTIKAAVINLTDRNFMILWIMRRTLRRGTNHP